MTFETHAYAVNMLMAEDAFAREANENMFDPRSPYNSRLISPTPHREFRLKGESPLNLNSIYSIAICPVVLDFAGAVQATVDAPRGITSDWVDS